MAGGRSLRAPEWRPLARDEKPKAEKTSAGTSSGGSSPKKGGSYAQAVTGVQPQVIKVYERELLMMVREFMKEELAALPRRIRAEDIPHEIQIQRIAPPPGLPEPEGFSERERLGSFSQASDQAPRLSLASDQTIVFPDDQDLVPQLWQDFVAEGCPPVECCSSAASTDFASHSIAESGIVDWPPFAIMNLEKGGWNTAEEIEDISTEKYWQLLARLRRAPGGALTLRELRAKAPEGLQRLMSDAQVFGAWLKHRTGVVEVTGSMGDEWVVLTTSEAQDDRRSLRKGKHPEASKESKECKEANNGRFSFDPKAVEFAPSCLNSTAAEFVPFGPGEVKDGESECFMDFTGEYPVDVELLAAVAADLFRDAFFTDPSLWEEDCMNPAMVTGIRDDKPRKKKNKKKLAQKIAEEERLLPADLRQEIKCSEMRSDSTDSLRTSTGSGLGQRSRVFSGDSDASYEEDGAGPSAHEMAGAPSKGFLPTASAMAA